MEIFHQCFQYHQISDYDEIHEFIEIILLLVKQYLKHK